MLGLMKAKPVDPVVIEASIVIDTPRESVFDLLDFSSPSNALRVGGYQFRENAFGLGRFCATHPGAPGVTFHFELDDYVANMLIGFRSWLECAGDDSPVVASRSDYVVVSVGDDRCRLGLIETASLKPGTSRKLAAKEREAMAEAVQAHMQRLKVLAEYGAEADVAA